MDSRIFTLPAELWCHYIPLNLSMVSSLLQSSSQFNFFARSDVAVCTYLLKDVFRLIDVVIKADYFRAKQLVDASPFLIFQEVIFLNSDNAVEKVSPLKYACKLLDADLVEIFYQCIGHKPVWCDQFASIIENNSDGINIDALAEAVDDYHLKYQEYIRHNIDKQQIDAAWLTLGEMQQKTLPMWVLKFLCRDKRLTEMPSPNAYQPCLAYNYTNDVDVINLADSDVRSNLGAKFSLVRGRFRNNQPVSKGYYSAAAQCSVSVLDDVSQIKNLLINSGRKINDVLSKCQPSCGNLIIKPGINKNRGA